jgi:hypothetical protein
VCAAAEVIHAGAAAVHGSTEAGRIIHEVVRRGAEVHCRRAKLGAA